MSLCWFAALAFAQRPVLVDSDPNAGFAQLDYAELYLHQQTWEDAQRHNGQVQDEQGLVASGTISIFDLQAPAKAIQLFNKGAGLLKAQNTKDAIPLLEKAIHIYPQFVSAHVALGLGYFAQHNDRARDEFRIAATLDSQFPSAFFDLAVTEIASHDYASAASNLQKAVDLDSTNTRFLRALADAQCHSKNYADSLRTSNRVHELGDRGMADVHYIAAVDAISLHDFDAGRRELNALLSEDPTNPLAPIAHKHLDEIQQRFTAGQTHFLVPGPITVLQTFPNSDRLHQELGAAIQATGLAPAEPLLLASNNLSGDGPAYHASPRRQNNLFTIRQAVDETALFLSISRKGHIVKDISASDVHILDDDRPPERILQFTPQSELPLRLGLLIDTSASVDHRFTFEKHAAGKFLEHVLNAQSDLAFVAGFSSSTAVTQDFTDNVQDLSQGIAKLRGGGDGTSFFDAIHFACRKLAAYPDENRVARVLVVLTDGQDNSSHGSLMQAIDAAEDSGVAIYTVNTADDLDMETDAARVLQTVADRSGGAFLFPKSLRELDRQFAELPELIRSRYLIAYKPANFLPNGKFRTLHVTANKEGKELKVHVRNGYFARLADNP